MNNESGSFTSRGEIFDYEFYKKLGQDPKVVAIGECGLDYYRVTNHVSYIMKQKETFKQHIELALELKKPLMLHIRDAYEDALEILDTCYMKRVTWPPGNCHFFAGSWSIAQEFLKRGFTLSFTGVITFTHDYDEIVKNTPLDMILTETDSPYVTPEPLRGKRNEPVNVKYVTEKIAILKGLPIEEVKEAVVNNAKRVFHI